MTARKFALQPTKTPAMTGGHDTTARPACDGDWPTFYYLIDHPGSLAARRTALDICDTCPIKAACWADNADEEWVQALQGGAPRRRTCTVDGCDQTHSAKGMCGMHYERARRGQEVA